MSLVKSHKGIVETVKQPITSDVFVIDFNCLIHRYLQDENPIQSVLDALEHILQTVCKAKQVIIAMDGVVPYAKIVQQRYRRMRIRDEGIFDRHQISPDTPYMRDLEHATRERFPYAIVSGTNEEGEGEHKLIQQLTRMSETQRRSICVYGLDADLILICLQHHGLSNPHSFWLLRESNEFNDPKLKHAEFATLSIWKLLKQLPMHVDQYVVLSILCFGNDFMPHLGMFSLREDGYQRALQIYTDAGLPDLTTVRGRRTFLACAAKRELDVFRERILRRKRPEEKAVLGRDMSLFRRKYMLHVLEGADPTDVVKAYWNTFEWTWYYFKHSRPLDWSWVYPYPEAPLVQDLVEQDEQFDLVEMPRTFNATRQLQFILPHASLRIAKRRVLYPDELYVETRHPWMKRHDWETKPRISLPWNPTHALTTVSRVDFVN